MVLALLGYLGVLLQGPAWGQDAPEPGLPAAGPVELEIIAFRQGGDGGTPGPLVDRNGPVPGLAAGELALDGTRRRLGASGFVTPLAHWGWRLTPGAGAAGRIPLPEASGLRGFVQVYRQGALFIAIEADWPGGAEPARIRETRRVRGTGLMYFDHPAFGIIAQVRAPAGVPASQGPSPGSLAPASGAASR